MKRRCLKVDSSLEPLESIVTNYKVGDLLFDEATGQIIEVCEGPAPYTLVWSGIYFANGTPAITTKDMWDLLCQKYCKEEEKRETLETTGVAERKQTEEKETPAEKEASRTIDVDAFKEVVDSLASLIRAVKI